MSVVYRDLTIDCSKVFKFKPLNGNNEVNESVEIPKNIVDSGIFIEQEQ